MASDDSMPATPFCVRLRRERERRQIALTSISANTKISVSVFEALERGDVSRWPSGIFRRSFIRAYAAAIGLDPDATAREFLEAFPDPLETAHASTSPVAPPHAPQGSSTAPPAGAALRLKLADAPTPFIHGRLLTGMRQRWAAVACDGGVVLAIALCVFVVCNTFWLPLGVAMIAYYLGGILLLGNTPGVCLLAPDTTGQANYNRPPDGPTHATTEHAAHPHWRVRVPAR
jgi:hypothetical protein